MFDVHERRRIELTVSCHDADELPKVSRAGEILERDGVRVQVMHNGILVEEGCYYGAWMTEIIRRLRGHHEPQEEAAFHLIVERLRSDTAAPVMLELGSFWAYYSLWFQHVIPSAHCVCVEPDPAYLDVGRRNAALNAANIWFIQAAIALPDHTVKGFECESDGISRELPVVSVDGIMTREDLSRVDLLLCDAQGAETLMLDGARAALEAGRIRFLVLSTHHHSISGDPLTHQRCLEMVVGAGGQVIAEHTVSESYSGDGLLVASFDSRDTHLRLPLSRARARESLFGETEVDLAAALVDRDVAVAECDRLRGQVARLTELHPQRMRGQPLRLPWRALREALRRAAGRT